jgi:hypothetical protein
VLGVRKLRQEGSCAMEPRNIAAKTLSALAGVPRWYWSRSVVLHRRSERPLAVAMMMRSNLAEAARLFQTATRMRRRCELLRIPHTISPSFPESDIEVEMLRAGIRSACRILANRGLSAASYDC